MNLLAVYLTIRLQLPFIINQQAMWQNIQRKKFQKKANNSDIFEAQEKSEVMT